MLARLKKLILLLVICALPMVMLSGCNGADLDERAKEEIRLQVKNRVDANLNMLKQLRDSGLITESEYNNMAQSVEDSGDTLSKLLESLLTEADAYKKLIGCITDIAPYGEDEITLESGDTVKTLNYSLANIIKEYIKDELNIYKGGSIAGYKFISDDINNTLRTRLGYEIYVINPELNMDISSLSDIYNALKKVDEGDVSITDEGTGAKYSAYLDPYFVPLLDDEGNPVTILDLDKMENQLVRDSGIYDSALTVRDTMRNAFVSNTNSIHTTWNGEARSLTDAEIAKYMYKGSNMPGRDLLLYLNGRPNLAIRITEFNSETYDTITSIMGSESKYLMMATGQGNRAYLLEYPVGYISGFDVDTSGNYEAVIEKSDLNLNLYTGKVTKSITDSNGNVSNVEISDVENRYTFSIAASYQDCSFVLDGDTYGDPNTPDDDWQVQVGGKNLVVKLPRIVLRDYLELDYTPNVVSGENLVAYGRMFRITSLKGNVSDAIARYIDPNGKISAETTGYKMYVYNFSDTEKLLADNPYNKRLQKSASDTIVTDEAAFEATLTAGGEYKRVDDMPFMVTDSIRCTLRFPGPNIAKRDNTDSQLAINTISIFYGMAVNNNIYDNGTMNWIIADSETESTTWWNKWLKEHSYNYQISDASTSEYLKTNYIYELGQAGVFVLDLETIGKLQQELDEDRSTEQIGLMRSLTKIFGYAVIFYGLIMLAAWLFDTNTDLGLKVLNKISFNKLIAVKDIDEIPQAAESDVRYVGFQNTLMISIICVTIGVTIVVTDVIMLVYNIISTFGGFASMLVG